MSSANNQDPCDDNAEAFDAVRTGRFGQHVKVWPLPDGRMLGMAIPRLDLMHTASAGVLFRFSDCHPDPFDRRQVVHSALYLLVPVLRNADLDGRTLGVLSV